MLSYTHKFFHFWQCYRCCLFCVNACVPIRMQQRHLEECPRGRTAKEPDNSDTRWSCPKRSSRLCALIRARLCCCFFCLAFTRFASWVSVRRLATFVAGSLHPIQTFLSTHSNETSCLHISWDYYHISGLVLLTVEVNAGVSGDKEGASPPRRSFSCTCTAIVNRSDHQPPSPTEQPPPPFQLGGNNTEPWF